jgi:putative tryptophan/tyrosine transport system substrate-binding protein
MMNRRSLLAGAGAVLFARPPGAGAQPPTRTARIGILSAGSLSDSPSVNAFLGQLRDAGWVDGQNLVVEYRWSERLDRLAALAGGLVRLKVDVLVTPGGYATKTARTWRPRCRPAPGHSWQNWGSRVSCRS